MATVTVELPSVLASLIGGRTKLEIQAATLGEALRELTAAEPALRGRLMDELGAFREHVLCFHNGENTRWREDAQRRLADGDRLRIMQAVSGG